MSVCSTMSTTSAFTAAASPAGSARRNAHSGRRSSRSAAAQWWRSLTDASAYVAASASPVFMRNSLLTPVVVFFLVQV